MSRVAVVCPGCSGPPPHICQGNSLLFTCVCSHCTAVLDGVRLDGERKVVEAALDELGYRKIVQNVWPGGKSFPGCYTETLASGEVQVRQPWPLHGGGYRVVSTWERPL